MNWWDSFVAVLDKTPPIVGTLTGVVLNGLIATCVALYVSKRGQEHAEELARKQAALAAAESVHESLAGLLDYLANTVESDPIDAGAPATIGSMLDEFERVQFLKLPAIADQNLVNRVRATTKACQAAIPVIKRSTPAAKRTRVETVQRVMLRLGSSIYDWRQDGTCEAADVDLIATEISAAISPNQEVS
ncbi:hypothetical protein [Fodinicola feengrottensis]|uniref:Uncharacterized protein n=1 Tax=Fodinicola feengrottensis TaxID=435914 RepID=A0ABN2IVV0_9ACTN|nr:hypothetical protein [Fodinicola feengrottensis]